MREGRGEGAGGCRSPPPLSGSPTESLREEESEAQRLAACPQRPGGSWRPCSSFDNHVHDNSNSHSTGNNSNNNTANNSSWGIMSTGDSSYNM